jgi:hypothetical protein
MWVTLARPVSHDKARGGGDPSDDFIVVHFLTSIKQFSPSRTSCGIQSNINHGARRWPHGSRSHENATVSSESKPGSSNLFAD